MTETSFDKSLLRGFSSYSLSKDSVLRAKEVGKGVEYSQDDSYRGGGRIPEWGALSVDHQVFRMVTKREGGNRTDLSHVAYLAQIGGRAVVLDREHHVRVSKNLPDGLQVVGRSLVFTADGRGEACIEANYSVVYPDGRVITIDQEVGRRPDAPFRPREHPVEVTISSYTDGTRSRVHQYSAWLESDGRLRNLFERTYPVEQYPMGWGGFTEVEKGQAASVWVQLEPVVSRAREAVAADSDTQRLISPEQPSLIKTNPAEFPRSLNQAAQGFIADKIL